MNGSSHSAGSGQQRALQRYVAIWDFAAERPDELSLTKGDVLLVAEEYDDGWLRGIKLKDLEIGFFPCNFVAEDTSPIYKLREIPMRSMEDYRNDPHFSDSDASRRSKIAFEIYTSEDTYLRKLRMLNEKFVEPLKQQTIISHEDYGPIFAHVQPLLSLCESLTVQLKSRIEGWDEKQTRIGDVFMHMGAHFKLFVTYAVHHTLGLQVLQKISKQDKFQKWLEKTEMVCQRTLDSLLLEPIQRVPRYEMLLKDLLKHTPVEFPDYVPLKDALSSIQKIATDCNENIRRAENELRLYAISKRFPSDDVDILQARKYFKKTRREATLRRKRGTLDTSISKTSTLSFRSFFELENQRQFIKEGAIQKVNADFTDPLERYLFLCSDVLVIAQATSKNKRNFKLKERVPLVHAWLSDTFTLTSSSTSVPKKGFILGTPNKMYRFLASNEQEKDQWYTELHKHILAQKQLFSKLLTHLNTPDEDFTCLKVRAKVHYLGMLKDELSFKSGDEILLVGCKNSQGKWKPGLYSTEEPFDPSPDWYLGIVGDNYGWLPAECVPSNDIKQLELVADDSSLLSTAPLYIIFNLKQRMIDLTGREVPPLRDNERIAKIFTGDGVFKTLRIHVGCTTEDLARMYNKVELDLSVCWSVFEMSSDGTVQRKLDPFEDPSRVVDFWGKAKDNMHFYLQQSAIVTTN